MSDPFNAKGSYNTKGAFTISIKDGAALNKRLEKIEKAGTKALQRTVNELTSRAPATIRKATQEHYGVDYAAFKKTGPSKKRGGTTISVAGITVAGASLEYKGRTLTPTHFGQSPKKRPKKKQKEKIKIPGQATRSDSPVIYEAPSYPYQVTASIIKGHKANMPPGTFIAKGLPWQKTGEGRTPVEVIHTLSVPQMISGRAKETIEEEVGALLEQRLAHYLEQALK